MSEPRLTLEELIVSDGDLEPAAVGFKPGLNLIIGASDTGKTFVFEAIDFMLGAQEPLRRIPESSGYTKVVLEIRPSDGPPVTLRRAFDGGQIEATEYGGGRHAPPTATKVLGATHAADPDRSLSAYLLRAIGLVGKEVRRNAQGQKQALSFRSISHLTLIGEERIIQQTSPIWMGQSTARTAESNVFAYLLTGQDDSEVIPLENRQQRMTRLLTEENIVATLLAERRADLEAVVGDPSGVAAQVERLESAIDDASGIVVSSQAEISLLEERRASLSDERTRAQSRVLFLDEQLKRLRLLSAYYETDRERLGAVIEASRVFHELPEGTCPLCNQPYTATAAKGMSHGELESACTQEISKIGALQADLSCAIDDFSQEAEDLRRRDREMASELHELDVRLQRVLVPAVRSAKSDLQRLIRAHTSAAQGVALQASVRSLDERLAAIVRAKSERAPQSKFETRATTSAATEFCQVVEEILRAWKYPELSSVSFDSAKADLVINGQDRANKGKGYRALTYAAFAIALMKYCRQKGIPHPGFVVLDTPLNPFKGPAASSPDDKVAGDVKAAFFEHLANDSSGDQIIIMENEEPPESVRRRATYHSFTKNQTVGRYGFFPSHDSILNSQR